MDIGPSKRSCITDASAHRFWRLPLRETDDAFGTVNLGEGQRPITHHVWKVERQKLKFIVLGLRVSLKTEEF